MISVRIAALAFACICTQAQASMIPLSFHQALKSILERSTALKSQRLRIEQVNAKNIPNRLIFLPTLSLNSTRNINMAGPGGLRTYHNTIGASASLNLFKFGADLGAMNLASIEEGEQRALLEQRVLETESHAVNSLINYIQRKLTLSLTSKTIERQNESFEDAKKKFDQGQIPKQELDRLLVDVLNRKAGLRNAQISGVSAAAELSRMLGHENVETKWPWEGEIKGAYDELVEAIPTPNHVPFYAATEARVARVRTSFLNKRSQALPSLDATFNYNINDQLAGSSPNWNASVTLSIPLFDRLQKYSAAYSEAKNQAIAEVDLMEAGRRVRSNHLSALHSFKTNFIAIEERQRTLETSERIYKENFALFKQGKVNSNDLVTDQNRLSSSEQFVLDGWANLHRDYVRLCHSLGRSVFACSRSQNSTNGPTSH